MVVAHTPNAHPPFARPRRAFSLVELLVVIAIIAVLIGLLLPALGGARRRGYKSVEMNRIKNVGHAWMLYSNDNTDAALPGFLAKPVQEKTVPGVSRGWGVSYKFPDNHVIPLTNDNVTGPWPWRLLAYLDYDHTLIHGHLASAQLDRIAIVRQARDVAYEPAFGYNGYYIGGWWEMVDAGGVLDPRQKFFSDCGFEQPRRPLHIPTGIAQIHRSSDMVTFCSSTQFDSTGVPHKPPDTVRGGHIVMPPMMQQTPRWRPSSADSVSGVEILQGATFAPIARYTNLIAVLYADGHVDEQGYNALFDQRQWIDSAEKETYAHGPCQ